MKSNSISLEDELQTLDKKCKLLQKGEWISLVLSGVGTVVTAITNQAIFAATPLTCSLFLNILSRSHQDKRVYDQSSQNLIEIQRQYASKLQGLRSEFLGIEFSEEGVDGLPPYEGFEQLATKVKQLESFLEIQGGDYYSQGGAINQEVNILRNHQLEMAETIEALTNQVEANVPGQFDPHEIQDHLDRLSAAVYELEQKTATLSEEGSENHAVHGFISNGSNFTEQLEPLQSQMVALEERMNVIATADPAYDPDTLQSNLHMLVQPLQEQLSVLEERIHEQTQSQTDAQASESTNHQYDQSLTDLKSKLDDSVNQISNDIREFQQSLQQTHEQVDQVHVRMNSIETLVHETAASSNTEAIHHQIEAINAPIREQLANIQNQLGDIHSLQTQIEQVRALAQHSSESLSPESIQAQVNTATAPLMEKIMGIEEKIQSQSANQDFTTQLHHFIEPVQSHMVTLEQRINQLSSEGDRTPLLNKIAALQGQLQTVESRLSHAPAQATDHSDELRQLTDKVVNMQTRLDSISQKVSQDLERVPNVIETQVEKKADLLSELQALSFEEEPDTSKKETKNELDSLLDSLNF